MALNLIWKLVSKVKDAFYPSMSDEDVKEITQYYEEMVKYNASFVKRTGNVTAVRYDLITIDEHYTIIIPDIDFKVGDEVTYFLRSVGRERVIRNVKSPWWNKDMSTWERSQYTYGYQYIKPIIVKFFTPTWTNTKVSEYSLPQCLNNVAFENLSASDVILMFPQLGEELIADNYARNMHILLSLEELRRNHAIKNLVGNFSMYTYPHEELQLIYFEYEPGSPYGLLQPDQTVSLAKPWEQKEYSCKIIKVTKKKIFITPCEQFPLVRTARYRVTAHLNRNDIRMMHYAIDLIVKKSLLHRVFPISCASPDFANYEIAPVEWVNKELDERQRSVVCTILNRSDKTNPFLIVGQPGTGKTAILVELISQLAKGDKRVLVVATHVSTLFEIWHSLWVYGMSKSDMMHVCSYSTYRQKRTHPDFLECSFVPTLLERTKTFCVENLPYCVMGSFERYKIILSTFECVRSLLRMKFPREFFSHVIIDNAENAAETDLLGPITFLDTDNCQLIVAGNQQPTGTLKTSNLFDYYDNRVCFLTRIMACPLYLPDQEKFPCTAYNPLLIVKLSQNYRSLPSLVEFTNNLFYRENIFSMICPTYSREMFLLKKIEVFNKKILETKSMVFVDVDGEIDDGEDSKSWVNLFEAIKVVLIINHLMGEAFRISIGVITPYCFHANTIIEFMHRFGIFPPKIGPVEDFFGMEMDVIIFSTVYNSKDRHSKEKYPSIPDCLLDCYKLNITLSRAKILNVIVGNAESLSKNPMWKNIIDACH